MSILAFEPKFEKILASTWFASPLAEVYALKLNPLILYTLSSPPAFKCVKIYSFVDVLAA